MSDGKATHVRVADMGDPEVSFTDDFDAPALDTEVWVPHYLPQWSSRAESAATYVVEGSELRLTIPPEHGLWCSAEHDPLRVSGIQSGVFSGEVGSTIGQQPFRDGQVVREFQPAQWGWTPHHGRLEVRARMDLSPRSMASVWMVGLEDEPERCGEICVFEVFGDALEPGSAAVGHGRPPVPRPRPHRRVRGAAGRDRRHRAPRLRRRLAARAASTSSSTASTSRPCTRPRTTRCR